MNNQIKLIYPEKYPVFFIGGSYGGVDAFKKIVSNIPEDFPYPIFIILHRLKSTENKNLLPNILKNHAKVDVIEPKSGDVIKGNTIYVAPHNKNITVKDNIIELEDFPDKSIWRPSIDVLFKSAAREYSKSAVMILLTGKLEDGIEGMREVTHKGGITITQLPNDAKSPDLPISAILKDHPRYIATLENLPFVMCELARHIVHGKNTKKILIDAREEAVIQKNMLMAPKQTNILVGDMT